MRLVLTISALFLFVWTAYDAAQNPISQERRIPSFAYLQTFEVDGIPNYNLTNNDLYPEGFCPADKVAYYVFYQVNKTASLEGNISFVVESSNNKIVYSKVLKYYPFVQVMKGTHGDAFYEWELPTYDTEVIGNGDKAYIYGAFWGNGLLQHYRVSVRLNPNCWK